MKRKTHGFSARRNNEYYEESEYEIPLKERKKERQKKMNKKIFNALRSKNIDALLAMEDDRE